MDIIAPVIFMARAALAAPPRHGEMNAPGEIIVCLCFSARFGNKRSGSNNDAYVRAMRRDELDFAVGLAANEGWNPGVHDADAFFATDPGSIARYDRLCFPALRRNFLDVWLNQPGSVALAWRENDRIRGYGAIRRCRDGWKVGPLFADNRLIAESLLLALNRTTTDEEPVYLDVPETNIEAMRLAADLGMHEVFGTARMYNRYQPDIVTERIFGVTTFELG